jgi:hypothetical protein
VQDNDKSQSIALAIEFLITDKLEGDEWTDWTPYEDHTIIGWFYVVKRDGTPNDTTVENLARVLGWDGQFKSVEYPPARTPCQIVVEWDEYNGQKKLKVNWLNPVDHSPGLKNADPSKLAALDGRYGSLNRAIVSTVAKPVAGEKAMPPKSSAPPSSSEVPPPTDEDSLPF